MQASQNLRQLLREHREQLSRIEQAAIELDQTDLAKKQQELETRNRELATQREELAAQVVESSRRETELREDNRHLRSRLSEEMSRQGEFLLADAKKQAELLFGRAENAQVDRLSQYNANVRARLNVLRADMEKFRPASDELLAQVDELEDRSRRFMSDATGVLQRQIAGARAASDAEHGALSGIQLDPARFEQRPAQRPEADRDRLEMRIGSRITIIVGAFFMLLAVVFGLRYTFVYLQSDILKGALAYFLGLLFLGGGELIHRRQPSAFSTGICAGGIAILFASTAVSYFTLGILSIPAAVIICIIVTALSLLQAIRYDAQLIAIFALLGGYLPMVAVSDSTMVLSAMAYFLLLNLFVLLVALRKRWQPLKYFSLFAGWASVFYLLNLSDYALVAGLCYIVANLLLYNAIVLVNPILRRSVLQISDTVMLGINTVAGCAGVFLVLSRNNLSNLNGAVALAFCMLFFILAKWLRLALEQDAGARGLFYATAFAFWVLAVPLQFEPELISLFWMIEGAALFVFGLLTERKWYRRAGGVIAVLCVLAFLPDLLESVQFGGWWNSGAFIWRYGAITLGLLVMVGAALYKYAIGHTFWREAEGLLVRAFKGIALVNLWLFVLYLISEVFASMAFFSNPLNDYRWKFFWVNLLTVVATLGLGVLYRAVPRLRTKGVLVIARILYVIGLLLVFWNGSLRVPGNGGFFVIALVLQVALTLSAVLAMYDLFRGFGRITTEFLLLGTSLYALVAVIQLMMVQAQLGVRAMAVSFVLLAWALGLILYGFIGRYAALRRFGLGLSLLSITKLFFVDLYLPEGQKIISYFVFGVVFIGISFAYQHFARKLFPAAESPSNAVPEPPPYPDMQVMEAIPTQPSDPVQSAPPRFKSSLADLSENESPPEGLPPAPEAPELPQNPISEE